MLFVETIGEDMLAFRSGTFPKCSFVFVVYLYMENEIDLIEHI